LLNDESEKLLPAGKVAKLHTFQFKFEECRITNKDVPELAIAYPEELVRNMYRENNLEILPPIHYGSWCNRKVFLDNQDIIIARKK
jgi:hypothetical protein